MNCLSKLLLITLVFIVLIFSCQPEPESIPSLDEKIGQMLLVGFRGTTLSADNPIIIDLERYNLGGVILYEKDGPTKSRPRNIESVEQVKKLVADLKIHSKEKLFVAIDEEGGMVSRLKTTYGFQSTVSAQYLGMVNREDTTRFYTGRIAKTLYDLGINLNFAPVVDLNVNPLCPVIGAYERSFSANPDTVIFHAGLYIDEHQKMGIASCCKHFPGHGSAANDSHLGLTDVTATWNEVELEPYRRLITSGQCALIMSAHVYNQKLDSLYPATLSEKILTGILRNQLKFNGLIVSDAMEMGAITENFGKEESIERALVAGCDILVFSNNISTFNENVVSETITLIHRMVDEGKISEERIDQSYQRIIRLKETL